MEATHFESVLNVANVLIFAMSAFLSYDVLKHQRKENDKELYNLLFLFAFLLMVSQLLTVLQKVQVLALPGGAALFHLVIASVLLYKLLIRQTRWKLD